MKKEKDQSSHFMLGVALGAALTALITTKTGRRLVRELTTSGTDLIEGKIDIEKIVNRVKRAEDEDDAEIEVTVETPQKKRVFRGLKKK